MTTNRQTVVQAPKAVGDGLQATAGKPSIFFYMGNLGGEVYNYFLYNYYWWGAQPYVNPNPTPLPPTGPVGITQLVPNGNQVMNLTGVRINSTAPSAVFVPSGNQYDGMSRGYQNCYRAAYEFSIETYNPHTQVATQHAVVDLPSIGPGHPAPDQYPLDYIQRISGLIPAGNLVYIRHYATGVVQYPGSVANTWQSVNLFLEFE